MSKDNISDDFNHPLVHGIRKKHVEIIGEATFKTTTEKYSLPKSPKNECWQNGGGGEPEV